MFEQFETMFAYLPDFWWNLLLVGLALVIGLVTKLLLYLVLRRWAPKKEDRFSAVRSFLIRLSGPVNHFLPLVALGLLLPEMRLKPQVYPAISKTVSILIILSFASVLVALVKVAEDYVLQKYDVRKSDNLHERRIRTQLQFVRRLAITIIGVVAACAILLHFDSVRKIGTGLLTGVGIGGIIIGFAAQKSLANFLAGFQIAFTQPLRIDDVLVVEGEFGNVDEITLTYVVLKLWDKRSLVLPITYFIEKPFQNWTRNGSAILGTVYFYLDHTAPIDEMRKELGRLLENSPLWDRQVSALQLTDIKQNVIEVRALVSASNAGAAFDLRCYIREGLMKFILDKYPYCLPATRNIIHTHEFKKEEDQGQIMDQLKEGK